MAALKSNRKLELPPYEKNSDDEIKIYYGEAFCRVEDCSKSTHYYSATNNLRTNIASHDKYTMETGNVGGRAAQKDVDQAISKWYKSLFAGAQPESTGPQTPTPSRFHGVNTPSRSTSAYSPEQLSPLPPLPLKKDGSVHITNMRKEAITLGGLVPCDSCGERNKCCKDVNLCDNFIFFDCGDIHPDPAPTQQLSPAEEPSGTEEEDEEEETGTA